MASSNSLAILVNLSGERTTGNYFESKEKPKGINLFGSLLDSLTYSFSEPKQLDIMKNTPVKYSLILIATAGLFVAGCSNPADKTESAKVSNAVEAVQHVASAKTYTISPDSTIGFVGSKVTGSHDGGFKSFDGTIAVANGKIVPPSLVTIQMDSVWTDSDRLTGHLKSGDFFEVEKFPTASFAVTSMSESEITGNFTLHGVTKSITFKPVVTITDSEVSLKAEFDIMRFDFGIVYKGKADDLIRDEVVIKLDVKAKADA